MKVVGLFAGIGGIELGLGSSKHETIRFCDVDPAAQRVLTSRFPGVPIESDIRKLRRVPTGTELLTAGFPCQDLTQVGPTLGLKGNHSSLVQEVIRLLRNQDIPSLLIENVPFMLYLHKGRPLRWILDSLEQLGYDWAYRIVDSRAFGRPQRRRRVFLYASRIQDPREVLLAEDSAPPDDRIQRINGHACGFYWTEGNKGVGWAVDSIPPLKGGSGISIPSAPAIVFRNGDIVTPHVRDAERFQGFPPGWTAPAEVGPRTWKSVRWRLVGNSVTVDVSRWIGRRINRPLHYDDSEDMPLRRRSPWPKAAWSSGGRRFVAAVSEWPVRYKAKSLDSFLRFEPTLLSKRAAQGFLDRVQASNLVVDPTFLRYLKNHVSHMKRVERGK